jgi:hypothetical protein
VLWHTLICNRDVELSVDILQLTVCRSPSGRRHRELGKNNAQLNITVEGQRGKSLFSALATPATHSANAGMD